MFIQTHSVLCGARKDELPRLLNNRRSTNLGEHFWMPVQWITLTTKEIVRIEVLRVKQRHQRERTLAERLLDDAIDAAFGEFQTARRHDDAESWRESMRRCLERVPERGQGVLKARFADELGYQQIGERLGMTTEAVRKTLFRLKKQVRSCVETSLRAAQ